MLRVPKKYDVPYNKKKQLEDNGDLEGVKAPGWVVKDYVSLAY